MSFDSGFAQGRGIVNDAMDRAQREKEFALQEAADRRAQLKSDQDAEQYSRTRGLQRNTDAAWAARNALEKDGVMSGNTSGMSDGSAQMLYGQGGQQAVDDAASYGNAESVRFGVKPKFTTSLGAAPEDASKPTVAMRKATDRDRLQGDLAIAHAAQNMDAATSIQTRIRDLDKRDIFNTVGKMSDDDIRAKLPGLNSSEMSSLPIYDAGDVLDAKGKATGYRELKIVKNGKSEFIQVSPAQLRQVATAHALMEGGFGEEGLTMLGGVSKDMAELVGKYNTTLKGAVDSGNTVQGHLNDDKNKAGTLAESTRHNQAMEARQSTHDANLLKIYGTKQQPKLSYIQEKDPQTGKLIRKPVYSRWNEDTKTMETFPVPAGMDTSGLDEVDPQLADLATRRQGIMGKYDSTNAAESDKLLAGIDKQIAAVHQRKALEKMPAEERLAEVKLMIKQRVDSGAFAALGISPEEIAAARKSPDKPAAGGAMAGPTEGSRTAPVVNPYVDTKGRPIQTAPRGDSTTALSRTVIPAVTSSGNDARTAYLQGKLQRKEPLTPAEAARAQQLGLTK